VPRFGCLDAGLGGVAGAQAQRPQGAQIVLRLHGSKPADDFLGLAEGSAHQRLVLEALAQDLGGRHHAGT
jgi:hypothetical protein